MMEFEKFTWRLQRLMKHNRKPILLFLGNGYESQIVLLALHKLKKPFTIVHVVDEKLATKTLRVFRKFNKNPKIILRPERRDGHYKSFSTTGKVMCAENLTIGFSAKDYLIITGFSLSEPNLVKAFHKGTFVPLLCPLLRYADEQIQILYQDMKDTEELGDFLFENLTSDSKHPNIYVC